MRAEISRRAFRGMPLRRTHSNRVPPALLLALLLVVSGCGTSHIRELRSAQDAFNRAAEAENRQRLQGPDGLFDLAEASTGYRVTTETVAALLDSAASREELRRDGLLCTAYTLRALSLWRLTDHEGALQAARTARGGDLGGMACTPDGQAGSIPPRERALLTALPALVRIEQANALRGNGEASEEDFDRIKTLTEDARGELGSARATVPGNHPVQLYLLASDLAALRGWHSAVAAEELRGERRGQEREAAKGEARTTLADYAAALCDQRGRLRSEDLQPWVRIFAFDGQEAAIVQDSGCALE